MPQAPIQQPAYILHTRPYRDTSLIVQLLTPEQGLISCIARGARRDKQRRQQALQPFAPLLVSLLGRGELRTLGPVENAGAALWLKGRALYGGLYANELLVRLLPEGETQYALFAAYQSLLSQLAALDGSDARQLEAPLRYFELTLLQQLGTCPQLDLCVETQSPVLPHGWYRLLRDRGAVPVHRQDASARIDEFSGSDLLALGRYHAGIELNEAQLAAAKRLSRVLLQPLLGRRPLRSRELFKQVYHDH